MILEKVDKNGIIEEISVIGSLKPTSITPNLEEHTTNKVVRWKYRLKLVNNDI